ncbi:MAG: hypothetical protein PVG41_03870 [Desulfobacteraceae bacterium]
MENVKEFGAHAFLLGTLTWKQIRNHVFHFLNGICISWPTMPAHHPGSRDDRNAFELKRHRSPVTSGTLVPEAFNSDDRQSRWSWIVWQEFAGRAGDFTPYLAEKCTVQRQTRGT